MGAFVYSSGTVSGAQELHPRYIQWHKSSIGGRRGQVSNNGGGGGKCPSTKYLQIMTQFKCIILRVGILRGSTQPFSQWPSA